jgi:hypothetical protein
VRDGLGVLDAVLLHAVALLHDAGASHEPSEGGR